MSGAARKSQRLTKMPPAIAASARMEPMACSTRVRGRECART
jgi:hypothetical protein